MVTNEQLLDLAQSLFEEAQRPGFSKFDDVLYEETRKAAKDLLEHARSIGDETLEDKTAEVIAYIDTMPEPGADIPEYPNITLPKEEKTVFTTNTLQKKLNEIHLSAAESAEYYLNDIEKAGEYLHEIADDYFNESDKSIYEKNMHHIHKMRKKLQQQKIVFESRLDSREGDGLIEQTEEAIELVAQIETFAKQYKPALEGIEKVIEKNIRLLTTDGDSYSLKKYKEAAESYREIEKAYANPNLEPEYKRNNINEPLEEIRELRENIRDPKNRERLVKMIDDFIELGQEKYMSIQT